MSTPAAIATPPPLESIPPPAVTTPPPRPPPPTALPKQHPDPSSTTHSNGGLSSPVKENKMRPIRSKTITERPRSGEVTSSRPEPPPLSARHRSYSTSSHPPPRKQTSVSPPFRPSPFRPSPSPSSPSPSSPSPSSPSSSSPSSSSPSHKPDRPPPPKKAPMQRPSRPPPVSQTSKSASLPQGLSSAAAMKEGRNIQQMKENSPSGSSPSHQSPTTTSAPTSPLSGGNIVNGVDGGIVEGASKLPSDVVDGSGGGSNGGQDERQTPPPEKPPRRAKKGNQQRQQPQQPQQPQQQEEKQLLSTKPDAVTNGDVNDIPASAVENHSPVTNGDTNLSPPVVKDSPSKTTADKPAIPRRPYQPPRPFPPPRKRPHSHIQSHGRQPESHGRQPESHGRQPESHDHLLKSKVEENNTHISNGIQPPQMLPVAQKNGASEAVVPSVKIEGERKEKGPHESGNESGQATHTRTLHLMSAENQTSEMSSPSRGRKILNSMKKSFRSMRQRKRDGSRKDSELKRSCSDTALAQVKEEEEEEGEAVEGKEGPRRYPDPLPQGIIPPLVVQCVGYINRDSVLREPGLFRIPGDVATIRRIRSDFVRGLDVDLSKVLDPHTVTGLLKVHFREQRVSLIPRGQPLAEIVQGVKSRNVQAVKSVLGKIFITHTATLRVLTEMFAKIVDYSEYNQMTSGTLATSCGPSIFPYVSPNNANAILKFLVDHYDEIFTEE